ncbi:MAG: hypothetical protein EOP01_01670, partial [Propionibacteriaceae bacterium]
MPGPTPRELGDFDRPGIGGRFGSAHVLPGGISPSFSSVLSPEQTARGVVVHHLLEDLGPERMAYVLEFAHYVVTGTLPVEAEDLLDDEVPADEATALPTV